MTSGRLVEIFNIQSCVSMELIGEYLKRTNKGRERQRSNKDLRRIFCLM